jgi:UDP-N-acetylmuramoyl-L-alanyl-D-glutamate--2,6-diaminopimelate ligase
MNSGAGAATLDALLAGIAAAPSLAIAGLTLDSRAVRKGDAFIALQGGSRHGLDHQAQAVAAGASALLWDPGEGRTPDATPAQVARVPVTGLRSRLGEIADRYYGAPSARLAVAGVTVPISALWARASRPTSRAPR